MRKFLMALFLLCGLAAAAVAHPPYGLVVDRRGDIYFSDLETVWRLSADGRLTVFRPAVPGTHVHELALAPSGAIEGDQNRYDPATERFYSGLWSRTPDGIERSVVPLTERPPAGAGVLQDRAGNRYATQWISNADRRTQLLRRRPGGEVDLLFDETKGAARPAASSVASVGGMAFPPDGSLYFTSGGELRRRAPNGNVSTVYKGRSGSSLRGIAATPDGVLAADMGSQSVLRIAADGSATLLFRETDPWLPTAAAYANGRLLVLEANADARDYENRVRLIEVTNRGARVVASPGNDTQARPTPEGATGQSAPKGPLILLAGSAIAAAFLVVFVLRARG